MVSQVMRKWLDHLPPPSWPVHPKLAKAGPQTLQIPAAHAAKRGVREQVRAVSIKDQMALAGPTDVGGKREAQYFGKGLGFQQADVAVSQRGEELSIVRGGETVEAKFARQGAFLSPQACAEDAAGTGSFQDEPFGAEDYGLCDDVRRTKRLQQPTIR